MKRILFGIFAHPDDEAFGPAAFLYSQAKNDVDVHLILVTDGEAGINEGYNNLAEQRLEEWHESGKRIGASSNHALHYPDGGLCNNLYLEISSKINAHIKQIVASYKDKVEIDFMTFDERGLSGHLDHIAVSFITTFIYEKLRQKPLPNTEMGILRYYCLPKSVAKTCNCDWIYMPAGRNKSEIDETIDTKALSDIKLHIMSAHLSQKKDMDHTLSHGSDALNEDNFMHHKNNL